MKVKIDDIASEIEKQLKEYTDEVSEVMKDSVDKASQDCMNTIKSHITFTEHTGDYVKHFKLKTSYEDRYTKRNTWYVSGGQHRLTHLLEYGHATVNGGRTRAFPHIRYGEEIAKENVEKYFKEGIK